MHALPFSRDHGGQVLRGTVLRGKVLRGMTDHGVGFRSPSSRKGVANAEIQAQARPTLFATERPNAGLRKLARGSRDPDQTRRLLSRRRTALAGIYGGGSRLHAV
ncbi:MAG: hypothetical protein M3Z96_12835, partial [Pseudomonadota bacterium]|nr:hypothetical protein [Pseudomonadota bacterium]